MSEFVDINLDMGSALVTPEKRAAKARLIKQISGLIDQLPYNQTENYDLSDLDNIPTDYGAALRREDIINEIKEIENQEIPKLYQNVDYHSPVSLIEHHRQDQGHSCILASALNAAEALGHRGELKEQDLANFIGENGALRGVDINKLNGLFKGSGLKVEALYDTLSLINNLENGGVVMLEIPFSPKESHEVLISAVKIKNNEFAFVINDPLSNKPYNINLSQIVNLIGRETCNAYGVKSFEDVELHDSREPEITIE